MELLYVWLTLVFNYRYLDIYEFLSMIDKPIELLNFSANNFKDFDIKETLKKRFLSSELKNKAHEILKKCQKEEIKILTKDDKDYPSSLKTLPSKPLIIFLKGNLCIQDEYSIAIVGARKYTDYGRIATSKIASDLACSNITIVSGMARGIDSFAHTAALNNNGRTIAILGSGVNVVYPAENKKLYENIINNGAVISEFMPDTTPLPPYFPMRNRIISGIALGTLVIEAGINSGSMITASFAAEQGKNIFAVPGNIFSPQSEGTNNLIKDGAKIVTSSKDILEEIYGELSIIKKDIPSICLSGTEKTIFENITYEPINVETLSKKLNLPFNEVNSTLTLLELKGYINNIPGGNFIRDEKYI